MKKRSLYPLIAGFYDFYFVALLIGTSVAFFVSLTQTPTSIVTTLLMLLLSVLLPIIYHALFSKRVRFISPGEAIVGRKIEDGHKIWTSPYQHNRWALFLLIAFDLLIVGNSWDKLSEGYVYTWGQFVVRAVIVTLVWVGFIDLGRGRTRGVLHLFLYFMYVTDQTFRLSYAGADQSVLQLMVLIWVGMAILNFVVVFVYALLRARHNRATDALAQSDGN